MHTPHCSSSFSFLHSLPFCWVSSIIVLFSSCRYSSSAALVMSCSFCHSLWDSSYPFHRTRYSVSPPSSRWFTTLSILKNPFGTLLLAPFLCFFTIFFFSHCFVIVIGFFHFIVSLLLPCKTCFSIYMTRALSAIVPVFIMSVVISITCLW
jgi:hypothetical protein